MTVMDGQRLLSFSPTNPWRKGYSQGTDLHRVLEIQFFMLIDLVIQSP